MYLSESAHGLNSMEFALKIKYLPDINMAKEIMKNVSFYLKQDPSLSEDKQIEINGDSFKMTVFRQVKEQRYFEWSFDLVY